MNEPDNISAFLNERLRTCRENRRSYEIWLSHLAPRNLLTIVAPAVLSVIAGSTILAEPAFLGSDRGRTLAGVCALASAVLTAIHKALNCDAHQAECRRIKQAYSSLEVSYERLSFIPNEKLTEELIKLDSRFEQIRTGAGANPPDWCLTRAKRELSTNKTSRD